MITVVAATMGFEVLGAQDPVWLSCRTLTRFWQLLLPRLASASALGRLTAEGHAARPRGSPRTRTPAVPAAAKAHAWDSRSDGSGWSARPGLPGRRGPGGACGAGAVRITESQDSRSAGSG